MEVDTIPQNIGDIIFNKEVYRPNEMVHVKFKQVIRPKKDIRKVELSVTWYEEIRFKNFDQHALKEEWVIKKKREIGSTRRLLSPESPEEDQYLTLLLPNELLASMEFSSFWFNVKIALEAEITVYHNIGVTTRKNATAIICVDPEEDPQMVHASGLGLHATLLEHIMVSGSSAAMEIDDLKYHRPYRSIRIELLTTIEGTVKQYGYTMLRPRKQIKQTLLTIKQLTDLQQSFEVPKKILPSQKAMYFTITNTIRLVMDIKFATDDNFSFPILLYQSYKYPVNVSQNGQQTSTSQTLKYCTYCSKFNSLDEDYCPVCGQTLQYATDLIPSVRQK